MCKIMMFLALFTIMSSISTLVALSFDRYFSVVRNKQMGKASLIITIMTIWIISFAVSSPQLYEYSLYKKIDETTNTTKTACGSHGNVKHFETVYAITTLLVSYIIPSIIIVTNYTVLSLFMVSAYLNYSLISNHEEQCFYYSFCMFY